MLGVSIKFLTKLLPTKDMTCLSKLSAYFLECQLLCKADDFCLTHSAEISKKGLVQCAGPAPAGGYLSTKPPIADKLNAYHIATLTLHICY